MRVNPLLVALTLAALTSAPRIASAAPSAEPAAKATVENDVTADYMVGKEDVLELAVFKYPDLNGPVTVRPDGKITLKLVGDIQAEGRTIPQINKEIETKLAEYIPEPHVTLSVRTINSMKVFVMGRVGAPGSFNVGQNVTVLQALAMAKGFTPWAKKNDMVVVRGVSGKRIKVNYSKVVKGKQENFTLYPGDTIVVP